MFVIFRQRKLLRKLLAKTTKVKPSKISEAS